MHTTLQAHSYSAALPPPHACSYSKTITCQNTWILPKIQKLPETFSDLPNIREMKKFGLVPEESAEIQSDFGRSSRSFDQLRHSIADWAGGSLTLQLWLGPPVHNVQHLNNVIGYGLYFAHQFFALSLDRTAVVLLRYTSLLGTSALDCQVVLCCRRQRPSFKGRVTKSQKTWILDALNFVQFHRSRPRIKALMAVQPGHQ